MERLRGRTRVPGRDIPGRPVAGSRGGSREGPGIDIAGEAWDDGTRREVVTLLARAKKL